MLKLTVHLQGWHSSFSQAFHQEYNLQVIYFYPRENKIPYGASAIYVLCKILLQIIGLHHEATLYMGFGNLWFMQDPPSDYWSSPRSKARLYMELTMPWSYGILFGLRLLACFTRVHRSVYPSSSSEEGSHRRIASECHLEK